MQQTKTTLIVQPGDSFFPIVDAVDKAESSINITVFRLDDPIVLKSLHEAHGRGVRVRLLVATSANGWEDANRKLLKRAKRAGIEVREPAGDSKKTRFHYKIITVDGRQSLVFTFNPTRENLHYTRDFGVVVHGEAVALELNRLFDADWKDTVFTPDPRSPLLVSPYNSRSKMVEHLEGATTSIHVWDAKLSDPAIMKILRKKASGGVEVCVLGDEKSRSEKQGGVEFRSVNRFKLHAKCVVVDGRSAILGSMNMRTECFDRRREACIRVDDPAVVKRLEAVFASDWQPQAPTSASARTVVVGAVAARAPEDGPAPDHGFVLVSRTDALRRFGVEDGVTSIGRADESDIVIADALVSRNHARFTVDGDTCAIVDLGSANGTFVNGERVVGTQAVVPGDVINIAGSEEFRFVEL